MQPQNPNQPQPANPARSRGKWLRWLAVPAAVVVVALVYQLTRPPELVCWRSLRIGNTGRRVRMLVPGAWNIQESIRRTPDPESNLVEYHYYLSASESRPRILVALFPRERENCFLTIDVEQMTGQDALHRDANPTKQLEEAGLHKALRAVVVPDSGIYAEITYMRTDLPAFNRTYKRICDSLTIE